MLRHHLLALVCITSAVAGDHSGGRDVINGDLKIPLETLPVVAIAKSGEETIVSVKNPSSEPLTYAGYAQDSPQVYRERREGDRWVVGGWLVSAATVGPYTLQPGQTVDFRLSRNSTAAERIYAIFSNPGGQKSSLVLLLETR
jgi:hypothetical protein